MKLFITAFCLTMVLAATSHAADKTCQSLKHIKSRTSIFLSVPEPIMDHAQSVKELNTGMEEHHKQWLKDNDLEMVISVDSMKTYGLLTSGWKIGFNSSSLVSEPYDRYAVPRKNCVYFRNIDLTMFYGSLMSIPKEFSEGSCTYKIIHTHEMKHYTTNEAIFRASRKKLEAALPGLLAEAEATSKPVTIPEEKDEARRIADLVKEKVTAYMMNEVMPEMKKQNALIDSPEEYAQSGKLISECPH